MEHTAQQSYDEPFGFHEAMAIVEQTAPKALAEAARARRDRCNADLERRLSADPNRRFRLAR